MEETKYVINNEAMNKMREKILKLELSNQANNRYTRKEMVKKIRAIIEGEVK